MVNVNISSVFLHLFEKVQHAVIISSKTGDIQWRNSIAVSLFDIEVIKNVISKKRLITKAYASDKAFNVVTLPSLLNFPMSFTVIQGMDFQIFISSSTARKDLQLLRRSISVVLEANLFRPAEELESYIELLVKKNSSGKGGYSEYQQQLKTLDRKVSEFRKQREEARSLLEGLEYSINKNDRVGVIEFTETVVNELNNGRGEFQCLYYNHEYGVLYGDQGLLAETLRLLILSSIQNATEQDLLSVSVYQGVSEVTWQWEVVNQFDQLSRQTEFIWGFQGGEVERKQEEDRLIFCASMVSGGVLQANDNDMALWAENELSNIKPGGRF